MASLLKVVFCLFFLLWRPCESGKGRYHRLSKQIQLLNEIVMEDIRKKDDRILKLETLVKSIGGGVDDSDKFSGKYIDQEKKELTSRELEKLILELDMEVNKTLFRIEENVEHQIKNVGQDLNQMKKDINSTLKDRWLGMETDIDTAVDLGNITASEIFNIMSKCRGQLTEISHLKESFQNYREEISSFIKTHIRLKNYALRKKAWQSSTSQEAPFRNYKSHEGANDAVDGMNSYTYTNRENKPWLLVDLGQTVYVGRVVLRKFKSCCNQSPSDYYDNLRDLKFTVSEDRRNEGQTCGHLTEPSKTGDTETVICNKKIKGRYFKVQSMRNNAILSFGEVEVYYQ